MKKLNYLGFIAGCLFVISCNTSKEKELDISIVTIPSVASTNVNYVSNRAPLTSSPLIKLPLGAIKPGSWLKESLQRQADGLMGNLGEISAWLQKEDNAWLSDDGSGAWGWEEVPYWLKGYANTGYILQDSSMVKESQIWFEAALKSQRDDGNFGPKRISDRDYSQDFWSNMIMLYCLQSYYEVTQDERVIDLMTNYFKYQNSVPDGKMLSGVHYWQTLRGGDNLYSVIWLYNRTGDKFLLDLAEKIHRTNADWTKRDNTLDEIHNHKETRDGMEFPEWYGKLVDWHNVNVVQGFREPAQYYQLSKNKKDLQATYDNFKIIRDYFGQVPGGMFGADENARPGYSDPRQGVETCGMVEQMNSDEHLLRITGDIFWADHAEEVAFNTYPAALMPDFRSLRYITSPNMVMNDDQDHSPGIANSGPFLMMNPFSSRCCQHNHGQGWAYFTENLFMATPDNGLAAVLYAAGSVTAKVNAGKEVRITNASNYPFTENLDFTINTKETVKFPLYFRIPAWAKNASVALNGKELDANPSANTYLRINREWNDGDKITLTLPKELSLRTWEANNNSVSLDYGPLTFSLKIDEEYIKEDSAETAIWDSKWQKNADVEKWPSFEIHPASPWNYGLILDKNNLEDSFTIETKSWPEDDYPFTVEAAPIVIKAKGKRITQWTIDQYGLAGELQPSPVKSEEPSETIELIPMGAARLRISAFPVIGDDDNATVWNPTK
ncbi:beta-L-arabinofuranosidase domain-containing protein [Leeuwenhoekiella marinoflava]|uniref:beta-L-arabinofuranosidase domain-containing protein n=1 Tax=Leeuwenhoekiella marinoflava TaxID=988 RepID=UPI00300149C0